jgi:hypothetical protein
MTYYEEHREEILTRVKKHYQENKEEKQKYGREYREKNIEKVKEYDRKRSQDKRDSLSIEEKRIQRKINYEKYDYKYTDTKSLRIRKLKIKALEAIANFHSSELKCWRCGETKLWVLTIGHINNDGQKDRIDNCGSYGLYRRLINGERIPTDLRIECMNCNCCLAWYKKYPDEIIEDEFRNGTSNHIENLPCPEKLI